MSKVRINPCAIRISASSAALALALIAVPAMAQDAAPQVEEEAAGDEIVVTGQFLDTGASSATKLDIAVLDTPFSVSAYSDDFMKAIETTNVSDLYRYMNGVQRAGNTGYDVTIRGFKSGGNDRNVIMTDGLPGLSVRFGSPPTIGVDHMEVVKGATSVLYGQAQPGGFINIITKKPKARAGYEVTLRGTKGIGTYDRAKGVLFSADATGPIDANGNLLYRIVGEIGDSKGYRDDSFEHPVYIAPSLQWNLGPDTELLLSGEYRRVKTHYDNQLVAPNRNVSLIPDINTSYQAPSDFLEEKGLIGNVTFSHRFSQALKFNLAYRYVWHEDTARGFDTVGFRNPTTLSRRARGQYNERTYGFLDANFNADFETFGLRHQLLLGGTIGRETSRFERLQFFNAPATGVNSLDINVYNPVHNEQALSFYPLGTLNDRYTELKSKGAYISDLITIIDAVKVMVGVRYADESDYRFDVKDPTVDPTNKHSSRWLPLAGIVIQPMKNLSFYGSYATSYVPVPAGTQDNFGNNPFPPTFSKAIEGGVKAELLDKKLLATAAYFDIRKTDTLNTFTCLTAAQLTTAGIAIPPGATIATGTCSAPVGGERSRGFELELSGSPLPGLQFSAGYTHANATVSDSNIPVQVGARLTNAPRDSFNLWTRYDFEEGALKGLGLGVGIAYIGNRVGYIPVADVASTTTVNEATDLLDLPSYTVVDLGLYYRASDNLDFTFKVSNLLDKRYIESAGFTADINLVPGTPRTAVLSARMKF